MSNVRGGALGLILAVLGACSHAGEYVWVDSYADQPEPVRGAYRIMPGDLVGVRVWNQESMSTRARVRPDGKISIPFLNDVEAAGLEPAELAKRLQARLKEIIVNPQVSVSMEEQAPLEVSVLGEVAHPGSFRLESRDATILKALAMAGGLTLVAGRDRIFVLRPASEKDLQLMRIRFTYRALTRAEGRAARFRLRSGDTIVVE